MKPGRRIKVIIMGAGGRDFHNFNLLFKDDDRYDVKAFTVSQLPGLGERTYPAKLSGSRYPNGIPILLEEKLPELIQRYAVDEVMLAYSDLTFDDVMEKSHTVLKSGASFRCSDPWRTMVNSKKPVIAVCAVRTGAGKSTVTRKVCDLLLEDGHKPVVIRHPMPYGDLERQVRQRFASYEDLDAYECTFEEREEYEPLIDKGLVVYAGIDTKRVLKEAEKEGDIIVFDGGNNDTPLIRPNLLITITDPLRHGQELTAYPGFLNVFMATVIVINKVNAARPEDVERVRGNVRTMNEWATIVETASEVTVDDPDLVRGKKVLVIEDGPTVTHGGLPYAAGMVAANKFGARTVIDPRRYAVGELKAVYRAYRHLADVVPTLGYNERQVKDLEETIRAARCDAVVLGTPIDLRRVIKIDKPVVRVGYEVKDVSSPGLREVIKDFESSL